MSELSIDFETYSAVDLRKAGVGVYAEDATTNVWCAAFALGDGSVELWTPDQPCPELIRQHVECGGICRAFNSQFEETIWERILTPRYGWPLPRPEQWRCTQSQAYAMGLPGSLDTAATAIQLSISKDKQGQALMLRLARPRKRNEDGTYVFWSDDKEKLERLYAYNKQDVEVERALCRRLTPLTKSELSIWQLDGRINRKGVHIDRALCEAAKKIANEMLDRLDSKLEQETEGSITSCRAVMQLRAFCEQHGVEVESLGKAQLADLLARDDLPMTVRNVLELRQLAAKTSVAKIDAMLRRCQRDGRMRYNFQYHGASTGRWAARGAQLQNLPRVDEDAPVDQWIEDVLTGDMDFMELLHESPLATVAACIRGTICAPPGYKLIGADFRAIESRVIAWLAGEEWKLTAFREFDAGIGHDMYILAYGRSFGVDPKTISKSDPRRQIGKVQELALGFGGGAGAFHKMALGYGMDIGSNYNLLCETAPDAAGQAIEAYRDRGSKSGMPRESWIAAEIVKMRWREAHPQVVALWRGLEDAAIEAVEKPGTIVPYGKIQYLKAGSFLWCRLPSGRPLCYPYPRLVEREMSWTDRAGKPVIKTTLAYDGFDSYTRKWGECLAYGGLLSENATQATARDLLAEGMNRLDAVGYEVVLQAHDEAVAEVPQDFGSVEEFCRLMSETPSWAEGCPISAAGWAGARYRKG